MSETADTLSPASESNTAVSIVSFGDYAVEILPEDLRRVEKTYLGGEHFHLPRITAEARGIFANVMLNSVELGMRLVAVKKALGHGNFTRWFEEQSGLPMTLQMARKYMAMGRAVAQRPELRRLSGMGITKAGLLLSLPEEQLDELAERGTINGEMLDEYETCTRKELQEKVRALKRQVNEGAKEQAKLREERDDAMDTAQEFKLRTAELTGEKGLSEHQQEVLDGLEDNQKLIERNCRLVELVDVSEAGDEVTAKLLAFTHWMMYRAERLYFHMQQRAVDAEWDTEPPTGEDWQRNEGRKAGFEGHLEADPL